MDRLKKFINIFKKHKKQWNISILVILILLSTSIIALLSINQIQHLMTYGNQTYNYFRAYYLAKAGTEVWLTALNNHEDWFEMSIDTGSAIISSNLLWEENKYEWFNPYFTLNLSGRFEQITDDPRIGWCTKDNKIELEAWEWIMLSMFSDDTNWNLNNVIEGISINPKYYWNTINDIAFIEGNNIGDKLTYWLFVTKVNENNWDETIEDVVVEKSGLFSILTKAKYYINPGTFRIFITIKNTSNSNVSFCLKWRWELISPNSLITSIWHFWDMEVWLQTVIRKKVPSRSLDVLGI